MSREAPVRSDGGMHDDYKETHPAYGMVGASRVSATPGHALFGSDFLHQNFMMLRVKHADLNRGLSHDWIHATEQIVEVALSEAQWATFISTPNVGDGVPCTLAYIGGAQVPGIIPDQSRQEQFRAEIDQTLKDAVTSINTMLANSKLNKTDRSTLENIKSNLGSNLNFVTKSFDEHAEKTIERAKVEVSTYITGAIQRAGLKSLGGEPPLVLTMEDE